MRVFILALATGISQTCIASAAGFEIFAPHRAVYDVKLEKAEDRSGIQNMDGRIVYEISGNECEGLSIRFRFVTRINTGRDQFVTDQRTSSFESPDGKDFSFDTKSFVNEQSDQKISGSAKRDNGKIKVQLNGQEPREITLGDGLFSSQHLVDVIQKAKQGESFVSHQVFDGSGDGDAVLRSSSVIGKARVVDEVRDGEKSQSVKPLLSRKAWPITMSYFTQKTGATAEETPVYEASFLLYADGVTRELQMRYPDYSLDASLTRLEYLEREPCTLEN